MDVRMWRPLRKIRSWKGRADRPTPAPLPEAGRPYVFPERGESRAQIPRGAAIRNKHIGSKESSLAWQFGIELKGFRAL